jgi:hypothetical protein
MATKLWLGLSVNAPTTGMPNAEQSASHPNGTGQNPTGGYNANRRMRSIEVGHMNLGGPGASTTTLANTNHYDGVQSIFLSDPLNGTDITAQTWTFKLAGFETNGAVNAYFGVVLYVWRPSNSSVVGYILDTHEGTAGGNREFNIGSAANMRGDVFTNSGAAVSGVDAGDILVFEYWVHWQQTMAIAYSHGVAFGGVRNTHTEPVDNTVDSAALRASISTPQDGILSDLVAPDNLAWHAYYYSLGGDFGSPADGSAVTTWNDEVGAHNPTQGTAGLRPLVRSTGGPNSEQCVESDGSDDILAFTTSGSQPIGGVSLGYSIVAICKSDNPDTNTRAVASGGETTGSSDWARLGSKAGKWALWDNATTIDSGITDDTSWHLLVGFTNGASSIIEVDGTQVGTGTLSTNVDANSLNTLFNKTGGGETWDGKLLFAGYYHGDVRTDANWSAFETWALDLITLNIPPTSRCAGFIG